MIGLLKGEASLGLLMRDQYPTTLYQATRPSCWVGDYITSEGGTGLVHTAPGHGQDDYQTGLKYDLPPFSLWTQAGKFWQKPVLTWRGYRC